MNSVCVVIPMYNEEKGAAKCIDEVEKAIRTISPRVGLIVVEAASKDRTREILQKKKKEYKNKLTIVTLQKNSGYGGALLKGTREASKLGYDFVLFMDSDLTNSPRDIPRFVKMASDTVDCVKATRYSHGGKMEGVPFYRQIISKAANALAGICFRVGLSDCTNGFRMVRVSMLKRIKYKEHGFAIILEELYELKKLHACFTPIPVILTSRTDTKTHFSYNWATFYAYGKYAIKACFIL